jgi:hypothetical protein
VCEYLASDLLEQAKTKGRGMGMDGCRSGCEGCSPYFCCDGHAPRDEFPAGRVPGCHHAKFACADELIEGIDLVLRRDVRGGRHGCYGFGVGGFYFCKG